MDDNDINFALNDRSEGDYSNLISPGIPSNPTTQVPKLNKKKMLKFDSFNEKSNVG